MGQLLSLGNELGWQRDCSIYIYESSLAIYFCQMNIVAHVSDASQKGLLFKDIVWKGTLTDCLNIGKLTKHTVQTKRIQNLTTWKCHPHPPIMVTVFCLKYKGIAMKEIWDTCTTSQWCWRHILLTDTCIHMLTYI